MEFRILGSIEARRDGRLIALDGAKQKTVLASLLLAREGILPDDRLSALLWGENPPATSSAQIYTYVSRLRKYLGSEVSIARKPPGYMMRIGHSELDHERFLRLSEAGVEDLGKTRYREASIRFREALSLWRGPALANVTEFLAETELPRLDEARMAVLEHRIDADLALGDHLRLISELTGLVSEYPLRERFRGQLMIALYRSSRQTDALAVFQEGRRMLAEEYGIDPGAALMDIHQAILTSDASLKHVPGGEPARVGGRRGPARPRLLPPNAVDFAGRTEVLNGLLDLLTSRDNSAPATFQITGMAGSGKTALAVRAAYAAQDQFPDGQLYGDLVTAEGRIVPPAAVLLSFLRALGMSDQEIPEGLAERVQLFRSLVADRRVLVVLDNAVDEMQVTPLLPSGQECRTIVTTRRDLATHASVRTIRLDTLGAEGGVAMLSRIVGEERVARDPESARRLVDLCGAHPLALRILGSRLCAKPHWSLAMVAQRIAASGSRLDELRYGRMDLRARIQADYDDLDEPAREAFALLSLLDAEEFSARTAALVLDVPEDTAEEIVESLVDAWMLQVGICPISGMPRYRFHELYREFGRERAVSGVGSLRPCPPLPDIADVRLTAVC
ncbi:AfsR/SARP family transcriptional regulator [Actinomadura litoris]|uniref:AfsR/SARP family transcriptional regulator n=1 Tax=Actinomadura litoris TaxID=2678616 RepID=UPI001FA75677|nr:AfsR/SARP family transcriptional regulator [Actinomadura litoris]